MWKNKNWPDLRRTTAALRSPETGTCPASESNKQVCLIAQNVEKIVPEVVNTDKDGYKSLAYDRLEAILIEAVKEQQVEIESLKKQMEELSSIKAK